MFRIMQMILGFILLIAGVESYNFLVISPLFGHSHSNFMGKIADTLTEAGHNVTVFMPIMDRELVNRTGVKLTRNIITRPVDSKVDQMMDSFKRDTMGDMWNMGTGAADFFQMSRNVSLMSARACEVVINDETVWEELKATKFDAGIAEPVNICGLAMLEVLNLPSLGAISAVQKDAASYGIGEPLAPSYVPGLTSGKRPAMGILDRFENLVGTVLSVYFFQQTYSAEIEKFREKFGPDFPSYEEILPVMSFMFTNSHPLLNYPKPVLQKTVDIGGITIDKTTKQELGKWDTVLGEREHNVFISFGSLARSETMPEIYKRTLLAVFEALPNITFIWKYEQDSDIVDHLKNVYLSKWLPQNALLADSRLSAFVTHGGLGSTLEVAHFGKPAIFVPLFAEQPRNAAMLANHGGAIVLNKNQLSERDTLQNTITRILNDKSFAENARRVSEMLRNAPKSPKDQLVRHAEFVARFGSVTNLDPYGRNLSIIEYYFIDVFIIAVVVVFVSFKIMFYVFRKLACCVKKVKVD